MGKESEKKKPRLEKKYGLGVGVQTTEFEVTIRPVGNEKTEGIGLGDVKVTVQEIEIVRT